MSAYQHVRVEVRDGVAIVTMDRPEVLNAMNHRLTVELHEAVRVASEDPSLGCIVITGAGEKAFSAGGDIHEQREDDEHRDPHDLERRSMLRNRLVYEISACPTPTIGMINGLAYGGAGVLSSCLDMRVGCEGTKFRFLAAAYGRINSTWSLPNQVGWPMAKELLFTARVVEAEEALRIGLLNHLVPRAELRNKTLEIATMIAANDRASIRGVKDLLLRDMALDLGAQWSAEQDYTRNVARGARAEDAFPDFIARKGR